MGMMGAKVFLDTNILLRMILTQMNQHPEVDTLVKRTIHEGAELWISGQVIREFIVQATHPRTLIEPLTIEQVIAQIDAIKPLVQIADETSAVRDQLLELFRTYPTQGKQIHDANIVATMLAYDIDTLLTLNVDDMKRFDGVIRIVSLPQIT